MAGAAAAAGPLGALAGIERGRWQFKEIGSAMGRAVCVGDPGQLIQFNHPGVACAHFTIVDAADRVTVQYNCGPKGYGKTTVTMTQPGQIRLDTQGITPDGRPFDTSYEGQFAGACGGPSPR
ncbi:hypothetical protein FPZ24_02450 [Sphingomonas panacisoli]|uniref:DUF3617 domain-containing protein n=1 Tax=Sphingomonas panacisoli TaxID=1813879 RepID=A0A5B8LFF3_9SPHN|nr:hypothetical protein [Sphingomonas panacisoli]QDZ06475.1 hypothetical protein FPZ24_02450 [Sphingomonas panacisoli]